MATSITLTLRCQSKNLVSGPDGATLMNVSLQTVTVPGEIPPPYSALTTTVAEADDSFVLGNLYSITITESS
jgi:hypothetical protein